MNPTPEKLRKIAEDLRNTSQYFNIEHCKEASAKTEKVALDPNHVLNFLRFFGA